MNFKILNFTPFPNLKYPAMDAKGNAFHVFLAKGSYDVDYENSNCLLSDEQEPINFTDRTYGELNKSSLRHPSEFVPYKPFADVIIDAVAYTPNQQPMSSWNAGIRIIDNKGQLISQMLRITGPRFWVPKWKRKLTDEEKVRWREFRHLFDRWELTEPDPIICLPINYEYAYGGSIQKGKNESGEDIVEAYEFNPVGCGYIDYEWTDHTKPVPAPQIEDIMDPIIDPYKCYKPAGFGPIPPAWLPRRPLGGTFDQDWIDHKWPDWPADYQFAYNNSSSPIFKIDRFIYGDINIELVNLNRNKSRVFLNIKDPVVYASYLADDKYIHILMNVDTLYLDIGEYADDDPRIYISWRTVFIEHVVSELQLVQGKGNFPDKALSYLRDTMEEIAGPQDFFDEEEVE